MEYMFKTIQSTSSNILRGGKRPTPQPTYRNVIVFKFQENYTLSARPALLSFEEITKGKV